MTPQEKARELLEKMNVIHRPKGNGLPVYMNKSQVKRCALIAVDEILHSLSYKMSSNIEELDYYNEVRQEIEKL